jgi:hypothetical protein
LQSAQSQRLNSTHEQTHAAHGDAGDQACQAYLDAGPLTLRRRCRRDSCAQLDVRAGMQRCGTACLWEFQLGL